MRVPFWLLRLLPMWDYICPACRKEVEKNSSRCPYCGERYGSPVRVPPKVLKDQKALEDYVHKYIFPKISASQRDYLAQYFTTLFVHGFEGGDFGEDPETGDSWTNTVTAGTTLVVSSGDAHHGTYKAVSSGLNSVNDQTKIYYNPPSGISTGYMRVYFKFVGYVFSGSGFQNFGAAFFVAGTPPSFGIAIAAYNPATTKFGIRYYGSGGYVELWETGTSYLSTGVWYCEEIKAVIDSSDGEIGLWIDGEEKINSTGLNTATRGNIGSCVVFAHIVNAESNEITVHWDCAVVADAYIGPEEEGATYTRTWQTDALFKKLGITKSLGADAAFQKRDIQLTADADVLFQKLGIEKSADIDVLLKALGVTKTAEVDALFRKLNLLESFGVDVTLLKRDIIRSFGVDARFGAAVSHEINRQVDVLFKKLGITESFGVDADFLKADLTKSLSADTLFMKAVTEAFGLDTALQKLGIQIQRQFDALLKALDITRQFGVDADFQAEVTATFGVNVIFGSAAHNPFYLPLTLKARIA